MRSPARNVDTMNSLQTHHLVDKKGDSFLAKLRHLTVQFSIALELMRVN
jgi:hypothetical protein